MKNQSRSLALFVGLGLGLAALVAAPPTPPKASPRPAAPQRSSGRVHATAEAPTVVSPPQDSLGEDYVPGQLMVAPQEGTALADIAARHGTRVIAAAGPSGFGGVAIPEGVSAGQFLADLQSDPDVRSASPNAYILGTSSPWLSATPRANRYQWHLNMVDAPAADNLMSDILVAVLDTGVAYENYSDATRSYVRAPSLANTLFVAPADFINSDGHANDDHQHGTHIASCILSNGLVQGVAPGASLMPIKVLDSANTGTELALLNGIAHAVEYGADVINMSLAFGDGYVPSVALESALEDAHNHGIVMVAAAGNEALRRVPQPAANRFVIAVGADQMAANVGSAATKYSNYSPRVDILAPGGNLGADVNGDRQKDGILAETIGLNAPATTGYWLYAGTSQAAALVTGGVVQLLHAGATADEIPALLARGAAAEPFDASPWSSGYGIGRMDVSASLAHVSDTDLPTPHSYYASILSFLKFSGGKYIPSARVTVLDESGAMVNNATVYANIFGRADVTASCVTTNGMCTLSGTPTNLSSSGDGWVISVDTVLVGGVPNHPQSAMFMNAGLEGLVGAMQADSSMHDALIAIHWTANTEPSLGVLAEAYAVNDLGTGLASSPMSMLGTPKLITNYGTVVATGAVASAAGSDGKVVVALNGGGLASSPMSFRVLSIGTGLTSSPMIKLLTLDGTGLASSPMSFSAMNWLSGGGLASSPMSFKAVLLGTGTASDPVAANFAIGTDLNGSAIGNALLAGGWTTSSGASASSVLLSSGIGGLRATSTVKALQGKADDAVSEDDAVCSDSDSLVDEEEESPVDSGAY